MLSFLSKFPKGITQSLWRAASCNPIQWRAPAPLSFSATSPRLGFMSQFGISSTPNPKSAKVQANQNQAQATKIDTSFIHNSKHNLPSEVIETLACEDQKKFRNVAIIAHVDHGKTTLVDQLLKQSGCKLINQSMDSNELEKEKGITILAKVTGITYNGYKINIVDTPGHHDFGGEVERIMSMVDGVLLLVCATEGPMPQTRFVLQKALAQGKRPVVIINKVDRESSRVDEVVNEIFDMFVDLDISDDLMEYPVFYASGRDGWAIADMKDIKKKDKNVQSILDGIIQHIPAPKEKTEGNLQMLITQTEANNYFGKLLIGKISKGAINLGDKVASVDQSGNIVEQTKVTKLLRKYGMQSIEINRAVAGDIVSVAGFSQSTVTHTINQQGFQDIIKAIKIDPPILGIEVDVNTSPMSGKQSGGTKFSRNDIKKRLAQEVDNDVALTVIGLDSKLPTSKIILQGRGDLHLGILIERMRREGFELVISPPTIIYKKDQHGKTLEPVEKLDIEVDPKYSADIIEILSNRGGNYINCVELTKNLHRLEFSAPTRGLIGFRTVLLDSTKGTAHMESHLIGYEPFKGQLKKNSRGAIISSANGLVTAYAMKQVEKFGRTFIKPGQKVYIGQVIGENQKETEVDLNPTKEKHLTNVRSTGHEEKIVLQPPKVFTIEEAISYIRDDELVEVTPKEIRIRKKELDPNVRKKIKRQIKGGRGV